MSDRAVRSIHRLARETGVEIAWAQWTALTAAASPVGRRRVESIVDPEALILASLAFGAAERRLEDFVVTWGGEHSALFSVQRMRSLAKTFPGQVAERIGLFATCAVHGGDKRWSRLASSQEATEGPRSRRKPAPLELIEGPCLMLRLRAGFGVGAKADALTFLLGAGVPADLKAIALATGYTERAVRTAMEAMCLAGFVERVRGRPLSYQAENRREWGRLLSLPDGTPRWRFWAIQFAFLAHLADWAARALSESWTPYVAASRARDLYEEQADRLAWLGLDALPTPGRSSEGFVEEIEEWLQADRRSLEERM